MTLAEELRKLHDPFAIYDDCGCEDHFDGQAGTVYVDDIGIVCNKPIYHVCWHCCLDGFDDQTEECVSDHDHGIGKPICATVAILDKYEGG